MIPFHQSRFAAAIRTAATLAAVFAMPAAMPAAAQTASGPSVIVTQGEASLKRAPDRAWILVSTETRDPKAAEARRRNADAMTAAQAALKGAGVAGDAIRTISYALAPDMEWNAGRSTMKGYVVRNEIEVRVDDLDKLSDILDAVNGPKGVALTVNGPRFDLKNQQAAENDALRQAVEIAMGRAQAIASAARHSLGAILRVEEQDAGPGIPRPMPMMAMRQQAADTPTPITAGEIEVHAQVTLTIEIK